MLVKARLGVNVKRRQISATKDKSDHEEKVLATC